MVETACFIRVQMHGVTVSHHRAHSFNGKDHPVRDRTNTVIESEVSEEVSDENTEPSTKINKQTFANMSTA